MISFTDSVRALPMDKVLLGSLSKQLKKKLRRAVYCSACGSRPTESFKPCSCKKRPSKKFFCVQEMSLTDRQLENIEKLYAADFRVSKTVFCFDKTDLDGYSRPTVALIEKMGVCAHCRKTVKLSKKSCSCRKRASRNSWARISDWNVEVPYPQSVEINDFVRSDERHIAQRERSNERAARFRDARGHCPEWHIEQLYIEQKMRCYFCDAKFLEYDATDSFQIDHLTPLAVGGSKWTKNIALVCSACNRRKHKKREEVYWSVIKKENGAAWTATQRAKGKALGPFKVSLTKMEKQRQAKLAAKKRKSTQ